MKKVYIDTTWNCEEARLETQRLKNLMSTYFHQKTTFEYTNTVHQADVIIFFACGHLQRQEKDSINALTEILHQKKPQSELIVWGCLTKINPSSIKHLYTGPLIGPDNIDFFCTLFQLPQKSCDIYANTLNHHNKLLNSYIPPTQKIQNLIHSIGRLASTTQLKKNWYVKIVSGCKHHCTYCTDNLAFKSLKSQPIQSILEQIDIGLKNGYKFFYLVGRDLSSYGYDRNLSLPILLDRIHEQFPHQDYKLYLHNISPDSLIEMYPFLDPLFLSKKVFEIGSHINSGSNRILKLMGKTCNVQKWINIMKDIDKKYSHIHLSTSIMVGFPSETELDFSQSVNLFDNTLFDIIDVYEYEERPNLPSLRLKGRIPENIKKKRYNDMKYYATLSRLKKRLHRDHIFDKKNFELSIAVLYHLMLSKFRQ